MGASKEQLFREEEAAELKREAAELLYDALKEAIPALRSLATEEARTNARIRSRLPSLQKSVAQDRLARALDALLKADGRA
jgi:hypothetical protein